MITQEQASFALTARALGALFYFPPDSNEAAPPVAAFHSGVWQEAWLVENGRQAECDQLLAWHLLPRSGRFLSVFHQQAAHPFYAALGKLPLTTGRAGCLSRLRISPCSANPRWPGRCLTTFYVTVSLRHFRFKTILYHPAAYKSA